MRRRCLVLFVLLAACAGPERGAPTTRSAPVAKGLTWTPLAPLPAARDHHATFAVETRAGSFLYAVGGARGTDFLADGWRARLSARGMTGAWEPVAPLPGPRAGAGVVTDGRSVLLVAGKQQRGKAFATDVVAGSIDDAGAVAWRAAPALPAPRFHLTAALVRGRVFAIGGLGEDSSATATVWSATWASGDLGPWTRARDLPSPRSHHASFVIGDRIFVAGGLSGDPTNDMEVQKRDVMSAVVGPDGALGEWQPAGELDTPLSTEAASVDGGFVWIFGGIEREVTDHVRRAPIGDGGALGPWQIVGALPSPRAHLHQVPIVGGVAFAVSGNGGNHVPVPNVAAARLE